jgi:tetratricopeptide (TPR) repeat protein
MPKRDQARQRNEEGRLRMDADDFDGAIHAFKEAIELDPELEWAWFNLGLIHQSRRNWEKRRGCNREAAGLIRSEKEEPAWWNLGISLGGDVALDSPRRGGRASQDVRTDLRDR